MLRMLALRLSSSRRTDGLWIGTFLPESEAQHLLILRRVEEALRLIKTYDRIRYNRLIRDLKRVWVRPIPEARASFKYSLHACQLDTKFVVAETTLSERIAAAIVHEATHARLMRCGIGYEEELRARVEAVCLRREIAFAAKLPSGQQVREEAERALTWYADRSHLTDTAIEERYARANLEELRNSGVPEWLLRFLLRVVSFANGRGVVTDANGRYKGEFRDGKRNGHGVVTWADGSRYEGEFCDGTQNGRGVFTWADGGRYEGEFRDGNRNGRGVFTWPDGGRYEGEWRDGNQNGHGIRTRVDGGRYEGEWHDGKANGRGVFTWADGSRYEGEWRDDKRSGRGVQTWADGCYEGEWRDDTRNGHGVQTWTDGSRYEGEWRDGNRSGRAVQTWANGMRYEGEWRDDKRNGRGVQTWADGSRYEGEWRDGDRSS